MKDQFEILAGSIIAVSLEEKKIVERDPATSPCKKQSKFIAPLLHLSVSQEEVLALLVLTLYACTSG